MVLYGREKIWHCKGEKTFMHHHIQRVAHRGGSHLAPENTLAAFRNALTLPIDAIELDVHMTRDGHTVVFHDYTVEKRTNGSGNMLDLDFAYVRSLNAAAHFAGGWPEPQQIPTLREVLELAKGHVQVYIEIKASKRNGIMGRHPNIAETVVEEGATTTHGGGSDDALGLYLKQMGAIPLLNREKELSLATRLEKARPQQNKVKIQYRKGTHAVATARKPITTEQVKALLADFP